MFWLEHELIVIERRRQSLDRSRSEGWKVLQILVLQISVQPRVFGAFMRLSICGPGPPPNVDASMAQ
jgi:hypothetical protein